jgi:hypothetical protein
MSEIVKLSASRIKTLQSCSWLYYCNYNLKLPQKNNSGAMRGTVAHLIFEVLCNPRHNKYVKKILKNNTSLKIPSICRLIAKAAKKEGLDLDEMVAPLKKGKDKISTLKCIDDMIMVGLKFDFSKQIDLIGSELEFDIQNDSPKYRIGGFIDMVFKEDDKIIIRDFKSSKQAFKGEELSSNIQALMYVLAISKKYKINNNILVKFLFLRFPDNPERACPEFSQEEIEGFEYFLEYISNYLNDFNEVKAKSNFAAKDISKKWMCKTKSGWECQYLKPIKYKVLIDKNGRILKSIFSDQEFKEKDLNIDGVKVEHRHYNGCPVWNQPRNNEFDF